MGISMKKLQARLNDRPGRVVTLPPSNGRNVGSLFTNPVRPHADDKIDITDKDSIRALVESAKAKGLIARAPVQPVEPEKPDGRMRRKKAEEPRAEIKREGVPTGLGTGAAAGVPSGVESRWWQVDAKQAGEWLRNNFGNRPVRRDTVDAYARDMVKGRWTRTHQGIAFNDRDDLIDGQHRLHAILAADKLKPGIKVPMMVTFGLPSKIEGAEMTTMDAVDRGAPRSVADQLKIQHGLKDGTLIAMIAKSLATLCFPDRLKKLSVGETLEIFRLFEPAVKRVIELRPKVHGLKSAGVLAAFAFAMTARPDAEAVFRALVGGQVAKSSALGALHEFLISPAAGLLMRGSDRALSVLVLACIHADAEGMQVGDIGGLIGSRVGVEFYSSMIPGVVKRVGEMFLREAA